MRSSTWKLLTPILLCNGRGLAEDRFRGEGNGLGETGVVDLLEFLPETGDITVGESGMVDKVEVDVVDTELIKTEGMSSG